MEVSGTQQGAAELTAERTALWALVGVITEVEPYLLTSSCV